MLNGEKRRHALRISFTSQKATREGGAEGGRENLGPRGVWRAERRGFHSSPDSKGRLCRSIRDGRVS